MGEALAVGLLDGGWEAEELAVAEVDADRRHALEARLPGVRVVPQPGVGRGRRRGAGGRGEAGRRGRRARELRRGAARRRARAVDRRRASPSPRSKPSRPGRPVVRAMPNTGALVGRGAAAIARRARTRPSSTSRCASGCSARVGVVVRVPETQLDAVTGLSGSGPAYVFLVAEAMIEAGVLVGLPRDTSEQLVRQTILGAATLLGDGDDDARVAARRGHVAGRHHRGRARGARGARRARRVPRGGRRPRPAAPSELGQG